MDAIIYIGIYEIILGQKMPFTLDFKQIKILQDNFIEFMGE